MIDCISMSEFYTWHLMSFLIPPSILPTPAPKSKNDSYAIFTLSRSFISPEEFYFTDFRPLTLFIQSLIQSLLRPLFTLPLNSMHLVFKPVKTINIVSDSLVRRCGSPKTAYYCHFCIILFHSMLCMFSSDASG